MQLPYYVLLNEIFIWRILPCPIFRYDAVEIDIQLI